jgi:hypothetical protein
MLRPSFESLFHRSWGTPCNGNEVRNAAPPISHPENFNPLSYARFIIQLILMTWHSDDERSIERQTLEHRHEFGFGEKATSK